MSDKGQTFMIELERTFRQINFRKLGLLLRAHTAPDTARFKSNKLQATTVERYQRSEATP